MQLFINNWSAVLTAPATASAVSLSVPLADAAELTGLGAGDHYLLTLAVVDGDGWEIAWEVVKVTDSAAGVLDVLRAQEGTAALEWAAGDRISARATKGTFEALRPSPAAVRATTLDGLSLDAAVPVVAADSLLVAIGKLQAQLAAIGAIGAVVPEPGTSRTLSTADVGAYIRHTNAAASVVVVAPQADQAWEDGDEVHLRRAAAGNLTLTPGAGVTLNVPSGGSLLMTDAMAVTLKRVGENVWDVIGQTVAA